MTRPHVRHVEAVAWRLPPAYVRTVFRFTGEGGHQVLFVPVRSRALVAALEDAGWTVRRTTRWPLGRRRRRHG